MTTKSTGTQKRGRKPSTSKTTQKSESKEKELQSNKESTEGLKEKEEVDVVDTEEAIEKKPFPFNLYDEFGVGEKELTFELTGKKRLFYFMKPKSTVLHDGKKYRLRYSPRLNEPFVDLQPQDLTSEDVVIEYVRWENGVITVPSSKGSLQKYLLVHPGCSIMGGKRFRLVDRDKEDMTFLELDEARDDVKYMIRNAYDDKLRAVYSVIFSPQLERKATEVKIRRDLIQMINSNDSSIERVRNAFQDAETINKYKYYKLFNLGIIEFKYDKIIWSDSKAMIVKVPKGRKPADVFSFELTKSTNIELLEEINRLLKAHR